MIRPVAFAVIGLALVAGAATASPRDDAKLHFELGQTQFGAGRYAEALREFQIAYDLAPFPDLLYNIGRCHEHLGDVAAAIRSYDQFLAVSPPGPERGALERHLVELRANLFGVTAPDAPPPAVEIAVPSRAPPTPIYRRWWPWTLVAVVVAIGAAIAVGVAASRSGPSLTFPPLEVAR